MNKSKVHLLIALIAVLATSACLVTLPAPASAPATPTPDLAMTGKAQTLTAAPTNTFTSSPIPPTDTSTTTLTPFPSITPLPTATATSTETPFGFVASFTPAPPGAVEVETPDPADGATDDWGSDFRCSLIDKDPSDWTVLSPKSMYRAAWTLRNSGKKKWEAGGIEVAYLSGEKLTSEKITTLNKDVKVGDNIKTAVNIYAPKEPGKYRSVWGLRLKKGGHVFCTFTVKVTVQ